MASLIGITHRHPEILSGTPVFVGTRVPVRSLFDYLEAGFARKAAQAGESNIRCHG